MLYTLLHAIPLAESSARQPIRCAAEAKLQQLADGLYNIARSQRTSVIASALVFQAHRHCRLPLSNVSFLQEVHGDCLLF
jgi:hypothetical protein